MKHLDLFQAIAYDPHGYAGQWKNRTKRPVVSMNCPYVPEELIFAAGALPYRLIGRRPAAVNTNRHLQVSCCSVIRQSLETIRANQQS